jgi:hypothetical protein
MQNESDRDYVKKKLEDGIARLARCQSQGMSAELASRVEQLLQYVHIFIITNLLI